MATLTIRNVPESTRLALKKQAAEHNQSMEAEVRSIIEAAVAPETNPIGNWLRMAEEFRNLKEEGDPEFELPEQLPPQPEPDFR